MKPVESISLLAGALLATAAAAREPEFITDEQAERGNLESVVVIGTRTSEATRRLAGSVDIIGRDELEYEHVDDTMELLTKVPGTYLSRFNQGIINSDIAIRGFAGDGSTPHVKLLIDGIPSNLHAGYPEMDQLFPLGIGSVQVFKGTSDAQYGLHNIAGNYGLTSRSDVGESEVEATVGSYDTREIQAYTGLETGALTHNYFAGYRDAGGYRDHTDLQKLVASGRWAYGFSDDTTLALIARIAGYEGDAPGYLTSAEARAAPRSSATYANQDGGEKDTVHASLHFDSALGNAVDFSVKAYWQQFERERWVRFSAAGSVQNRFDDERQVGFRSTVGWDMTDEWRMSFGIDAEHQRNLEQRFGTVNQTRERDPSNVIRNNHFDFATRAFRVGCPQGRHHAGVLPEPSGMAGHAADRRTVHWKWYLAFHQVGDERVAAQAGAYREGLMKKQRLTGQIGWVLPPVAAQASMHRLAATDLPAQLAYEDSIRAYHAALRRFYYPYLFNEVAYGRTDFAKAPIFSPAP